MGYKKVKLKEIGKIITGNTPSKKNDEYYNSNDIMFIKPNDINTEKVSILENSIDYLSCEGAKVARVIPKGSVFTTCIGIIGKVGILNTEQAAFNQQINAIIPDEKVCNSKFLAYNIFYNKEKLKAIANAPVVPIINKKQFSELEIPLPPLETQKKIANVLDKAMALIDKRKEQIQKLDEFIQSVFLDMFGDPVNNPKGWEKGKIRDISLSTQYGTSKKASESKGNYPILRMNNITYNGNWDFSSLKYVELDEKESQKYLVYKGELLFNRTNSKELVGKTAVYREDKPMAFAGYLVKLIPNKKANSEFISGYLNSVYGKKTLYSMAKNIVGMANINAEELKNIKIYIPPIELQNKFAQIVQKTEKQKELLQKSLVELENNFNSLMQRAFKGELFD
ncbi:restriction endonuclease subunit S [Tepidibacter thalassicus]|uniref:Type I restriction enzyme, S subunit n=1 Tax=Tepidibacter thalassicus DSM 15285 TaxID=1123350 RepID=A0A1M5TFK6_9FIRM|nr:restriction endonuclease subunit S [Tepidibacter thalassicus]SHH49494.1 type I restriction enzyme, S subunit [Tepidibacter thalassicus DSM 15285]